MTTRLPVAGASQTRHRHHRATKGKSLRAALLCCWTLRYVVKRRIIFFSLRFDGFGYRVRVGLASGDKDLCTIFLHAHTDTHLPLCEGGTCIHIVNPTSLCCALLYPLSRPPAYCSSSRGVETLPPYRFSPFPLSRTDGRTFFAHCFSVSVPAKKRVIDTVQRRQRHFVLFLLCTRGLAVNTWSTGDMSL